MTTLKKHVGEVVKFIMFCTWVTFSTSIFWIALASDRPAETDLIAVLAITIAAVIVGSLATTVVHHLLNQLNLGQSAV